MDACIAALLLAASAACLDAPAPGEAVASVDGRFVTRELGAVDLTAQGTLDWAHWGLDDTSDFNRKAGGAGAIGNFSRVGSSPTTRVECCSFSWADGTPTEVATDVIGGVLVDTDRLDGEGFRFAVAADTTPRTLTIYVGGWCARFRFEAVLGAGPSYTHTDFDIPEPRAQTAVYEIEFSAATAGDELEITYTVDDNHCVSGDLGEVWLLAATLAGPPA